MSLPGRVRLPHRGRLTPLEPWIAGKIGSRTARLSRAELDEYQLARLRATIDLARDKSTFYRRHFAAAPRDLRRLADIAAFPFTTAQDLRSQPLHFVCVSQDDIARVVTLDTSGTTGDPKRIYFTREDQELTVDFFRVGMSTFTDPGDRVAVLLPVERPGSVGDLLAIALERLGAHPIRHGLAWDPVETLATLERENANGLVGVPAQVLATACQPGAARLKLKSVLLSMDHVPDAIERAIEQAWGATVYNHLGMTETGLGFGVQCEARRGYHWREADLYTEIIDPETGEPVGEGESGEIVVTTLTRRGMPLIRYRTGDVSAIVPGDCPCGTMLKTLDLVRNRLSGYVRLGKSATLTMAELDEALFAIAEVTDFSATVTRGENRSRLQIEVQLIPGFADNAAALVHAALDAIPAIHAARVSGELVVEVTTRPCTATSPHKLGKRKIIEGH